MRRRLFTLAAATSLVICVATVVVWHRSWKALDEVYGEFNQKWFQADSFAGCVEVQWTTFYHSKPGAPDDPSLVDLPRPFDQLEEEPGRPFGMTLTRARWPLVQTARWNPDAPMLPGFRCSARLAWAREGPGRYDWGRVVQVPYWFVCLGSAVAPVGWLLTRRRGTRPDATARACPSCGYDLRATPQRCPECGCVPVWPAGPLVTSIDTSPGGAYAPDSHDRPLQPR